MDKILYIRCRGMFASGWGSSRTLARSYFMQLFDNCVDPASGFCGLVCCHFRGIIEKLRHLTDQNRQNKRVVNQLVFEYG